MGAEKIGPDAVRPARPGRPGHRRRHGPHRRAPPARPAMPRCLGGAELRQRRPPRAGSWA